MATPSECVPPVVESVVDQDDGLQCHDLELISLTGASAGIFVGAIVLVGWALGADALTTFLPGPRATQPMTAVCLILAGYSLIALKQSRFWQLTGVATLALVMLLSLHALLKHITGTDLGLDNPLFPQTVLDQPKYYAHPGRPSAPTATAFVLIGIAVCLRRNKSRAGRFAYSAFATAVLAFVGLALIGDLLRAEQLTGLLAFSQVGIPTAIGLCGLSVSLLAVRPDVGWVKQVVGETIGASAARSLLLAVVALPVVVHWAAYRGYEAGLYSFAFSLSLDVLVTVLVLAGFTLRIATQIDRLAAVRGHLLHVQDDERRRMARDLHDSASQLLVSLQLDLAHLKRRMTDLDADQLLSECSSSVREIQNEIRTMAFINHPVSLETEDIGTAISKLAAGFAKRSGLEVESFIGKICPTSQNGDAALYRIAQEALANVHRHSGARKVKLRLDARDKLINLSVEDDGIGFDQDDKSAPLGVGILGMTERVEELGGRLSIRKLAHGTSVTASIPCIA